jgi:ABC-type molybdenum transport system ATPase subunit/photorepair protein PhrA
MTTTTTARPTDGSHLPVVHLNGSGKAALLAQYDAMHTTLNEALDAMYAANPHGRDYYPKGDDALAVASAEYLRRLRLLEGVRDDVMADWLEVADGGRRR